ncbi:VWA domain-containing protein [Tissierella carlieri]|jgi:hypothetical protein|uniref:VWA domain-containing protein n=1 Tax=Tissierella carlieri TaxID=689904 RepID=UPI001C0F8A0B|nr:VWA domain-containing protein [Tissierella carlieri]MBU5311745.1 VWA domain-containing protein [Tissierella carlieri]MDU5080758.1 VWA domain-containing protein [Bacillota bacterium]
MKKIFKISVVFVLVLSMCVSMGLSSYTAEPNENYYYVDPENPPVDPEVPPVDPENPPVDPENPPVDPENPPVDPENPPVDPENPPVDPENPPVDPENPPVDPENPPVDPENPPVNPEVPPLVPIIPTTDLVINHIEKYDFEEELIETEILEGLEVGGVIFSLDYVKEFEGLSFVESDVEEIILIEGENIINLYYTFLSGEYIPENPDFPPGEGEEIESPYIEEFWDGELGPFEDEEDVSRINSFSLVSLESYPDEVNNKTWPNPGSLLLNKSGIEVPGTGNQWEITLEIQGKDKVETSDIVLVIDRSGSMSGQKITDAKNAAKNFVNTLLSDSSKNHIRIAVVSFAGDVTVNSGFQSYSGRNSLISAINSLNANGGTHIQAGIRQGSALLNGSIANYKNIVLLGDGAATYSYKPNSPNSYLEFWKYESNRTYSRTTSAIPESGFNYGSTVGAGNSEYTEYQTGGTGQNRYSYNYRHGAHAVAEAEFAKSKGYEIYTIALNAGSEGDWTLENIASSGNYYSTASSSNLNIIFQEIAERLSNAATGAVVTDPLGDMYSILGINAGNYNSLITVSHGTLSYDTTTDKIIWNIGTINEGIKYWMKYRVTLDYSAEGGVFYPANKPTYIEYENIDGNDAKKYFPIPEFRLRALTFTKLLNSSGYGDKDFDIILEGPTGQYKKTWAVSLNSGQSKSIKGLLPGTYTVREIVPMNFKLIGMSGGGISYVSGNTYELTIGYDDWNVSIDVINERDNDGWFWEDPDPKVNSFTVGETRNHSSLPIKDKLLYTKLDYFIIPATVEIDNKFNNA